MKITIRNSLVLSIFLALVGCESAPHNQFADVNRPLAEQGKMKWSDYYQGLYDAALASNVPNKGQIMGRANSMIQAALAYEDRKISEQQFAYFRREVQAAQATDDQAEWSRRNAALAAMMKEASVKIEKNANENAYQIVQPARTTTTNCTSYGNQLNCTTR